MSEPGFCQISLNFTYAINIGLSLLLGFLTYFVLNDPPLGEYYAVIGIPATLLVLWNLRYSKVVMLYCFGDVWRLRKRTNITSDAGSKGR